MLFILFDIEAAFLFPWAARVPAPGPGGLLQMAVFIFVLLLGLLLHSPARARWTGTRRANGIGAAGVGEGSGKRFGDALREVIYFRGEETLAVDPARIVEICRFLKEDPEMDFDMLLDITGNPFPGKGVQLRGRLPPAFPEAPGAGAAAGAAGGGGEIDR